MWGPGRLKLRIACKRAACVILQAAGAGRRGLTPTIDACRYFPEARIRAGVDLQDGVPDLTS
jgi:hypothetical protein